MRAVTRTAMAARRKSSIKSPRAQYRPVAIREIVAAPSDSRKEKDSRPPTKRARTGDGIAETRVASAPQRLADLEAELAQAHAALARQRQEREEDAENFARVMARLAQTERTLSQAKSRLADEDARTDKNAHEHAAELEKLRHEHTVELVRIRAEFVQQAEALNNLLSERELALTVKQEREALLENSLSYAREELQVERQQCETLRAQAERLQSELTSLQAKLSEAETREKKALEVMETMRDQVDERSAQAGQLREKLALAREREHELIKALEASRAELAKSENARHTVTQALTAMESLALDIKRIAVEARGVPSEPPTQAFAGLRVHMPSEAPEILIDGVMMKSEEERRGSESSIPTLRPQRD